MHHVGQLPILELGSTKRNYKQFKGVPSPVLRLVDWIDDPAAIRKDTRMPRINPTLAKRSQTIDQIVSYLTAISKSKIAPIPTSEHGG